MRKLFITLFLILVVACGYVYLKQEKQKVDVNQKPIVKIGVMVPASGVMAEIGTNSKEAVLMALDESGNSPINFDIIIEDDGFSQARAANIANKFVNIDKVQSIVSSFSGVGNVVSSIADKSATFHINVSNSSKSAEGDLNFTHWQLPKVASKRMSEYLASKNANKVLMFAPNHSATEAVAGELEKALKEKDIELLVYNFMPENKDFSTIVDKAKNEKDVDYWILFTFTPSTEIIRREMLNKKINIPLTSIQSVGESEHKYLFEGVEFVDAPEPDKEFNEKMKKRIKSENLVIPSYVYDSVKIIVHLNESFYNKNGRIATSEELAKEFDHINDYKSIVGDLIIGDGGVIESPSVLKKIENGKSVVVAD